MAFSIRARSFRGQQQVAIELKDYRPISDQPISVRQAALELVDLRIEGKQARIPPSCLVWAEGPDAARGSDRFHLQPAEALCIWTAPPGYRELRAALAVVKPQTLYAVAAVPTVAASAEDFLTHLAGLTKFAIGKLGGKTSVSALAAACAQRELTIRIGLEWLAARGHLQIEFGDDDLVLRRDASKSNQWLQRELYAGVKSLLDEAVAYRDYLVKANLQSLF